MLYDFGADFQARTTVWEIGVLAYTILHARVDLRDTTELFRVLTALGADPAQIHKSLWEDYLTRIPVACMKAQTPREKAETCIQNAIACAINVTQRYLLHIAHANGQPSPHTPERGKLHVILALLESWSSPMLSSVSRLRKGSYPTIS